MTENLQHKIDLILMLCTPQAIIIQKNVRMWQAVYHYKMAMRGMITLQGLVRCFLAKKQLKKLKIEARSVEHQRKLNKGLENKIISLQQKLTEAVSCFLFSLFKQ